ncbi:uncharacterized protein LOC135073691 [Ostrinia nubilalis]|uniref:uncharacterized protein LOC135073691 n=1 Tax=Ostrinia nubilalis TaxID=29057 RepID=UPI0030826749
MSSVIERFGDSLGAGVGARATRVLLAAAHERQPIVAHQLWGCLLALMYSVPDWHKWLDRKDLLIKRILEMLEKGGWGDARRLSDMLLPLLAHLPPDLLTRDFHEAFFGALCKGLLKKNILSSKSERQYWITSLSECLRYLSIQQNDYVLEVVTSVHRTWLKNVLLPEHDAQLRNNLVKHSATTMVALIKYWLKQSKEPNGEKYDQLIRNFWQNVASTVLLQLDETTVDAEKIVHIIEGHILLLQTLKTAFLSENKKPLSIKFHGDVPNEEAETKVTPVQELDAASIERYKHNLNEVVEKIVCGHFEFANKIDICEPILTPLITILNEFDSKNLYIAVGKHFNANGVYELYDKLLRTWMVTDTMRCKAIVDVIFILMKHLTDEEQDAVLASFDQFPCGALEWCVSAAACHLQWTCAGTRRWLRGRTVRAALLALTRRLLRRRCAAARSLLLVCLSRDAAPAGGE